MKSKVVLAIAAAAMLCGSSVSGMAFIAAPVAAAQRLSDVHSVTFWGRSFPFRYNWSLVRACTRYEPVETTRGTRMHRVWVCGDRRRYSYR